MSEPSDDREWVGAVTGGRVVRFDQATAGRSRATWLVDVERDGEQPLHLVLRRDTGDGPLSGTELSLQRESAVYAALAGTGVAIPHLWGIAPDGAALLVERVEGTEDLAALGDRKAAVIDAFLDAAAVLHGLDVDRLDLPGFERPSNPEDHALIDLGIWERVFDGHVDRPAPLIRFALRWLRAHAPGGVERTVLCHGDFGPGNFLHDDGRVTALLDWEFAHLGDPMDDIAWFTVRAGQVADIHDLGPHIDHYEHATGLKVDADRVAYYQAFVLTRMAIACLVGLSKRSSKAGPQGQGPGNMDASTYHALLPILSRQLVTLLAERADQSLEPTALPEAAPATSRGEVLDVINTDLGSVLLPELQTDAARSRAMGMFLLLMHLQAADTLGGPIDEAEIADLAELLGERPASPQEGWGLLDERLDTVPEPDLLAYFSRYADRQVALWPPIAGHAGRRLPRVGR